MSVSSASVHENKYNGNIKHFLLSAIGLVSKMDEHGLALLDRVSMQFSQHYPSMHVVISFVYVSVCMRWWNS